MPARPAATLAHRQGFALSEAEGCDRHFFRQAAAIAAPQKSPVRENRTPGSVRGLLGNWQSYRDGG